VEFLLSQADALFLDFNDPSISTESKQYLEKQLITYIGNKRGLAKHLSVAVKKVRDRVGGRKLTTADLFAGSGFVARLMKQHSTVIHANDLEQYAAVTNRCFLMNASTVDRRRLADTVSRLNARADSGERLEGFFQEMYAPKDDRDIQPGERVFYTTDNARRLDLYAQALAEQPEPIRTLLLGPLLSRASMHANTSGVFKGFYKDKNTGVGRFGGTAGDALTRILEPIRLELPELSRYDAESHVYQQEANALIRDLRDVDLAYIDPPYNQHPYGSNYFMLNLICNYRRPDETSAVSGIPTDWNRSGYNVKKRSFELLNDLIDNVPARFVLISFNEEGFVDPSDLRQALGTHGTYEEIVVPYNTFRGSRNLRDRSIHVNEHLFLLDRK
jgi:adenine-specific DNA-methyltransferase